MAQRTFTVWGCGVATIALSAGLLVPVAAQAAPQYSAASEMLQGDFIEAQWGLTAIRAEQAWTASRGKDAVVAVIDTGVDAKHPDLAGQLVDGAEAVYVGDKDWAFQSVPAEDSVDFYGHGTHVSGIVVAKDDEQGIAGVAPSAKVMPINVLDAIESAGTYGEIYSMLADAVLYSANEGAHIISMSLGLGGIEEISGQPVPKRDQEILDAEKILCDAVAEATDIGALVIVAAGNDGTAWGGDNPPSQPATCDGAMSVAASGPSNTAPTSWSSSDPTVAITAPGEFILSTFPLAPDKKDPYYIFPYGEASGTSMATPMVSGVAALLVSQNPDATPAEIRNMLESTATDIGLPGRDSATGYGLLDAAAAVGVDSVRSEVSASPYLPLIVRPAYSTDPSRYTAAWAPPLGQAAPTGYTVEIADSKTSNILGTYNLDPSEVRVTFSVPKNAKAWVFLTATYADGSTVKATPAPLMDYSSLYQPIKGLDMKRTGDRLTVSWNKVNPADADALYLGVWGSGIDSVQRDITPRKGAFPTSVTLTLTGDVRNSDISVYIAPAKNVGGGWFFVGRNSVKTVFSSSPAAVRDFDAPPGAGVMGLKGYLNNKFFKNQCSNRVGECAGRKVKVDYRILVKKPKGGKSWIAGSVATAINPLDRDRFTVTIKRPSRAQKAIFVVSVMEYKKGKPSKYRVGKSVKFNVAR